MYIIYPMFLVHCLATYLIAATVATSVQEAISESNPGDVNCMLQARAEKTPPVESRRTASNDDPQRKDPGEPLNILFMGNSFTYGPAAKSSNKLINLPRFFKLVAESKNHKVNQQEDTIGGCSLYAHRPSANAHGRHCSAANASCQLVDGSRVVAEDDCTIGEGINYWDDNSPCPQFLGKQDYGAWDVVVIQDHSKLPTVKRAREEMLNPTVEEIARVVKRSGTKQKYYFGRPVVAAYMTWGYYDGTRKRCPGKTSQPSCFPLGDLTSLSDCDVDYHWANATYLHQCQSYSLARGYSDTLSHGADVVVPCGLAWEAARGSEPIPQECKDIIDSEYNDPGHLSTLNLPLRVEDQAHAMWAGENAHKLYRWAGILYKSNFCDDGCHHDHHASPEGMYLNALVFFATLFKESPIGADFPNGQMVDGMKLPSISEESAKALQQIAHDVVIPHMNVWWPENSGSAQPNIIPVLAPEVGSSTGGLQPEKLDKHLGDDI